MTSECRCPDCNREFKFIFKWVRLGYHLAGHFSEEIKELGLSLEITKK